MKKNILVVDDSALMRRMFCDIINSDERFHVMNKAMDGEEALGLLRMYDYDAVVLDINMPKMNGIELLREMQRYKIKTRVMLASSDTMDGAKVTLDALELGAIDFIHKPNNVSECKSGEFQENFLMTLAAVSGSSVNAVPKAVIKKSQEATKMVADLARKKARQEDKKQEEEKAAAQKAADEAKAQKAADAAKAREARRNTPLKQERPAPPAAAKPSAPPVQTAAKPAAPAGQAATRPAAPPPSPNPASPSQAPPQKVNAPSGMGHKIVAIASSTGGPKAIQPVLTSLPKDLAAPVVLVQHMPKGFTKSLAERLDSICELTVKEAVEGEVLQRGYIYIAKGGLHMHIVMKGTGYIIHYTDEPPREGVKPCANYMYESLRTSTFDEVVCVVMTGMGADGTEGIANLKKTKKVHVIVQEKSSCAVYGMPKSVVSAGLADQILPLDRIAQEIIMNVGVK